MGSPPNFEPPAPHAAPMAQPGWYPSGDGNQRYWDGTAWTNHIAPGSSAHLASPGNDDNTMGMLMHLLPLFFGFVGPLVLWLWKKDESPYIDYHGKEALNFQITLMIASAVSFVMIIVFLIGLLMLAVLFVANIVLSIMAAIAANKGAYYRYPATFRFIK